MSWGSGNHSMSPPGCRSPFLKPKLYKEIVQGIQKWVQTNQLPFPPISDFFKKLFSAPKIVKRMGLFVDFPIFVPIYVHISKTSSEKFDCRTSRICWKYRKLNHFFMHIYWHKNWKINKMFHFSRFLVFQKIRVTHEKTI